MAETFALWATLITLIGIFWVLPAVVTYNASKRKNRNYRLWTLFAVLFGWATAIVALLVTKLDREVKF